jgi:hypothetical protein
MSSRVNWSADNVGKEILEYRGCTNEVNRIVRVTAVGESNFLALMEPHFKCEVCFPKHYDNDEFVWRYHD